MTDVRERALKRARGDKVGRLRTKLDLTRGNLKDLEEAIQRGEALFDASRRAREAAWQAGWEQTKCAIELAPASGVGGNLKWPLCDPSLLMEKARSAID